MFFTNIIEEALSDAKAIFISVNTPSIDEDSGKLDMSLIEEASKSIGRFYKGRQIQEEEIIVVEKSTVSVGTCERILELIEEQQSNADNKGKFTVVSIPEFLSEDKLIKLILTLFHKI